MAASARRAARNQILRSIEESRSNQRSQPLLRPRRAPRLMMRGVVAKQDRVWGADEPNSATRLCWSIGIGGMR